jgi:hypothetical protein
MVRAGGVAVRPSVVALLTLVLVSGCRGAPAASTPATAAPAAASCRLPPRTYDDLAACTGSSQQLELKIASSYQGKSTAKIAVPSKDPQTILAAMGAYTAEWSIGADSWTLFAYGSADDASSGVGYNRGRLYWNNGGPITVDICTDYKEADGVEACSAQSHYTVTNR